MEVAGDSARANSCLGAAADCGGSAVCARAAVAAQDAAIRSALSFRRFIFALKRKYPMHAGDGQKPIARHFQSQVEGRLELDARDAGCVGRKVLPGGMEKRA